MGSYSVRPVSLIAAAVAAGGAFIGWFDTFGTSTTSFDIALPFLIDYDTTASSSVSVGLLVVVLAGCAAVLALIPSLGSWVAAIQFLGVALIAVAMVFFVQLVLATDNTGLSVWDLAGIGPFVTGAAGIGLLTGK